MLNQTKRLYKSKSKSKIFITILCIFGLLFSWSCSCKNRVSDPNETPPNGGLGDQSTKTNYVPKTYTATRSGNTLIMVSSDGSSITPAKISFKDAKVTNVTVDVGTTGFTADVFKYESGGLTMTAFDSVTTTRQKVTATFSLAPNESRDTLLNPTETVDIEVVKSKGEFDKKTVIGTTIKTIYNILHNKVSFQFSNDPETDKLVTELDFDATLTDSNVDIDKNDFATSVLISKIKEKVTNATSIEFVRDTPGTDTHSFVYKFKFPSGYGDYEQTEDQLQNGIEYTIEVKTSNGSKTITFK